MDVASIVNSSAIFRRREIKSGWIIISKAIYSIPRYLRYKSFCYSEQKQSGHISSIIPISIVDSRYWSLNITRAEGPYSKTYWGKNRRPFWGIVEAGSIAFQLQCTLLCTKMTNGFFGPRGVVGWLYTIDQLIRTSQD